MIDLSTLIKHYKREDVQNAIIDNAQGREVAIKFGEKGFGKRPDTVRNPKDILELALQGATSFHASEELWKNPLLISPGMKKNELEELRKGWDLVLDIDCNVLEYSKIAADILMQALRYQGVKSTSCKFSGRAGFHIGVPFEAFPETVHGKETRTMFPDGARAIALYLREMIREPLSSILITKYGLDGIMNTTGKTFPEIVLGNKFNPFSVLDIDTILISPRHLYRMPYCFNEKSGWVSIPVDPLKVRDFDVETAKPEKVVVNDFIFLDRSNAHSDEGRKLLIQAFDFATKKSADKIEKEERDNIVSKEWNKEKEFEAPQHALPQDLFPPCIKKILGGVDDGKKRAVFILVNFLTSVGWDYDAIETLLKEWNERNKEPLREVYYLGQLRYHKQQKKKVLPPNCSNKSYYIDLQICSPDGLCKYIKNPVNYTIVKAKSLQQENTQKENNGKFEGARGEILDAIEEKKET